MTVSKRDYKIATIALYALAATFLLSTFAGYFYRPKEIYEYGIVVDISSYDIEFNLYKWKNNERVGGTAIVDKVYTFSCDARVHVDELDMDDLTERMFRCVRQVTSHVENFEIYNSTLFIYGTEMTRLLCVTDPEKCIGIFNAVTDVVQAFDIQVSPINVRSLSGHEEASYGWISVNDYLGRLRSPKTTEDPLGGLDVKNYSVLISFEGTPAAKSSRYSLYGNTFNLESIDLMCYGVRQAYNRALLKLAKNARWGAISHPCHVESSGEAYPVPSLYGPCVPKGSVTKSSIRVSAGWDLEKCQTLVRESLWEYDKVQEQNIDYFKNKFDLASKKFFGFSRIGELAEIINFDGRNFQELFDKTVELCNSSVKTRFQPICFDIFYIYHLVVERLDIPAKEVFVGRNEKIETVTGAIVFNSKTISARKCACLLSNFGLMFMLFSVAVFVILGLFVMFRGKKTDESR